ncbi:DNA-3-methyladenine glycosylase family protein [Crenobacter cavernae]|uniref:DNA-3-methyladenine glycosylase II n=1 Tax=Crenobacter cavernae TaxID=2290923 RepID=A0A345Y8G5_9NEIS|nr:DNA-3-methyladenine glycosylase [Crenobacter cavernae]AXK40217.1 DNA-3-methyladenine glycosylase 2 family protein [Crenobacter cavernae]
MSPERWQAAAAELASRDARLAHLIERFPDSRLVTRGEPFQTLLRAIVGQQLSMRAADAIWSRLVAAFDPADPAAWASANLEELRAKGLSQRKAEYVRDLAQHTLAGDLKPHSLAALDDDGVIRVLTGIRGLGRWSAEMFLIFNLARPEVWPVDDIGLQRALVAHGWLDPGTKPKRADCLAAGEVFRPWRTVATWYLWRSLDPAEIVY